MFWLRLLAVAGLCGRGLGCSAVDDPRDCKALECFAKATHLERWTQSEGWLGTTTVCSWFGVGCRDGRVSNLTLGENKLKGFLPSCIEDLGELEVLDLHGTKCLAPPIPQTTNFNDTEVPWEALFALPKLSYLDLGYTYIGAGGSYPADIDRLGSKLELLRMTCAVLTGPLPQTVTHLTGLRVLKVGRSPISGKVPFFHQPMLHLEKFAANFCALDGSFPDMFLATRFPKLTHLVFDGNSFTGPLPASIGSLPSLQELGFNVNNFSGKLDPSICAPFSKLNDRLRLGLGRVGGNGTHCHIGSDTQASGPPFYGGYSWVKKVAGNQYECPLPACAMGDGMCNRTKSFVAPCH